MDNSTTTIQESLLLGTQLELVVPTTVAGTLYGIAFTIFCCYVHSLVPHLQAGDRKRQAKFMLGYSSIIMLCGLYSLISNAWITQDTYIMHADYPGSPFLYLLSTLNTQPVVASCFSSQLVVDILTLAILQTLKIWRVWVVWSATRFAKLVTLLPLLCFLTLTIIYLMVVIRETTLPPARQSQLDGKLQLAQTAIQGATTGKANGSAGYMKIVAILVESYALESVWILAQAILFYNKVSIFLYESRTYIASCKRKSIRITKGKEQD
ncbi:hypothetical protein AGABI1DRAFT_92640 [Agaricus bisporus var. burnettii JB137-S8]|uniref:Uncharacterized protein n=1 Tax=Agaricus bisporus var. burnettii (strain JB137-S8 / ATCC MYA-4627 / FGSC 10392) TaxID=597362 RepID=K5XTE8_AGABU|nr:uncharacterized protein AGABI1DRAFT_92640 [Agaricus bisporus var. burnettii JB137-S8]EKM78305.1 hypothetical protein AGABI1DRAFT_92640 [Agaricus bisporus var. burnettii JB137-S8]